MISEAVESHPVVIFAKSMCPYSKQTKKIIQA